MKRLNGKQGIILALAAFLVSTAAAEEARAPRYKYVALNVPGSTPQSTVPTSINNLGVVTGSYLVDGEYTYGFTYDTATKVWTRGISDPNGIGDTYLLSINDSGTVAGFYLYFPCDGCESTFQGMTGKPGNFSDFSDGCLSQGYPTGVVSGISNTPWTVGYCNDQGQNVAWSNYFSLNYFSCPSYTSSSYPTAVNNNGVAVGNDGLNGGSWVTSNCSALINYPGTFTYLTGINDSGTAIGYAVNSTSGYSFITLYNTANGDFTPLASPPKATNGISTGQINNHGWFVGNYSDSNKHQHAFYAQPVK